MGPWALRLFRGILGALKGTYRVHSRYIRKRRMILLRSQV